MSLMTVPPTDPAFDAAFSAVISLVDNYEAGRHEYCSNSYQEVQARQDFIDKFWIALGWDVRHEVQLNPYEQEVKVERTVAGEDDYKRRGRKADYAILRPPNFNDVRFFVEAKRPGHDLDTADDYFQIIRYAWPSHCPISVLMNFEQFRVLDCRYRPDIDSALSRAISDLKFCYSDYRKRDEFARIYYLFSRPSVVNGSLERYAENLKATTTKVKQRGLFAVGRLQDFDDAFLEDLDTFRAALARNFKKHNPALMGEELTEATQRTLDRLVFMRFLEDKLIETEPIVEPLGANGGSAWRDFVAASRRLDRIYNGIIFKKHSLLDDPSFVVDDEVFIDICDKLSHTNSPYAFHYIPIPILGSIYERFLGKVIVATAKKAEVVSKPEIRKADGVYYTPTYIVNYIVAETVGNIIAEKTPDKIAELRFADIACGSGSFLLGIYDCLLRRHVTYYNENTKRRDEGKKAGCVKGPDGTLHLSLRQKRQILTNNIYGVDLDSQAVEVAQLSLYLKLLEEETTASARLHQLTFGERLLPSLQDNFECGNSLVRWDQVFTPELEKKLKPRDLEVAFPFLKQTQGFDAVIGNPPYVDSEWMTRYLPDTRKYCSGKYIAASGNWDLFCVFIERALELCKPGGVSSLIVPNKLSSAEYASGARRVVSENNVLEKIRDYSAVRVFPVSVYPIIFVARRSSKAKPATVGYEHIKEEGLQKNTDFSCEFAYDRFLQSTWNLSTNEASGLADRLRATFPPLGGPGIANITGAATVAEAYEIAELLSELTGNEVKDGDFYFANSGTIDRYEILWGAEKCRYLGSSYFYPVIKKSKQKFLGENRKHQARLPKIIVAGMTKQLECALDATGGAMAGKSTSVITSELDLHYLVGVLNSRVVSYYYNSTFGGDCLQGGYLRIGPPQLRTIPIPELLPTDPKSKEVATLVKSMIEAKNSLRSAKTSATRGLYVNKCAAIDGQIDKLVYKLYSLTSDEIAAIETMEGAAVAKA